MLGGGANSAQCPAVSASSRTLTMQPGYLVPHQQPGCFPSQYAASALIAAATEFIGAKLSARQARAQESTRSSSVSYSGAYTCWGHLRLWVSFTTSTAAERSWSG